MLTTCYFRKSCQTVGVTTVFIYLFYSFTVWKLVVTIVGNIRQKLVLTYASTVCGITGVGECGEFTHTT